MREILLEFLAMSEDESSIYSYFSNLLFWIFLPFTSLFWFSLVSDLFFSPMKSLAILDVEDLFSTLQIHTLCPISIQVWLCIWEANLSMFLFIIAFRKLPLLEWKHFKQWEMGSLWPIWHSYWVKSPNALTSWCDKTVASMFTVRSNMNSFHACCCFVL